MTRVAPALLITLLLSACQSPMLYEGHMTHRAPARQAHVVLITTDGLHPGALKLTADMDGVAFVNRTQGPLVVTVPRLRFNLACSFSSGFKVEQGLLSTPEPIPAGGVVSLCLHTQPGVLTYEVHGQPAVLTGTIELGGDS